MIKKTRKRSWAGLHASLAPLLGSVAIFLPAGEPFQLQPSTPEAQIGTPFEVYLQCADSQFDPQRILRVESKIDPDQWSLTAPWKPVGNKSGGAKEVTGLWSARISAFETGDQVLPETCVFYRADSKGEETGTTAEDSATTTTIKIAGIRDPKETKTELVGLRPLYEFPRDWAWTGYAVGGALATAALAYVLWLLWKRRKKSEPEKPSEPELPPGPWALRQIERLRRLNVCREGPVKEIDSLAADVVRGYLARRFLFDALEMTTYECVQSLQRRESRAEYCGDVRKFLNECDLVKFSKFEPTRERWQTIWEDAKAIVLATTPAEELGNVAQSLASEEQAGVVAS